MQTRERFAVLFCGGELRWLHSAERKNQPRHPRMAVFRKIIGSHDGRLLGDVRVSQRAPQHPSFALRQLGIVVDRIHAFDDLNRGLLLGASSGGFGIGNPFNSREQMFSYLLLVKNGP